MSVIALGQLYAHRRIDFEKLTEGDRRAATRAIGVSCREDYIDYVEEVLNDIEITAPVATVEKCPG